MTDTQLLDWLEQNEGYSLISDDFGNWAVVGDGLQNIPDNPGEPSDIESVYFIETSEWCSSVRDAIIEAMNEE